MGEKDAPPERPSWLRTCPLPAKSRGGEVVAYPVVDDELAVLWLLDYGCVDLHVWTSRCDRPDRPDYVLFDPTRRAVAGSAMPWPPLAWDELREGLDARAFTMAAVVGRLERLGDLAAPLLRGRQRLDRALASLAR